MGNRLEIDIAIKGNTGDTMIAPLLLFSFIENSFNYIGNKKMERKWINLEFQIEPAQLTMKLIHGKTTDPLELSENENALARARKRLDYIYPGNYELKTTVEPEIMMTYLKIMLEEPFDENEPSIYKSEQLIYATI
jgi:LytS/YehU family sensor histidine kinase